MDGDLMLRMRAGLEAWQRGDVSALEPLLDPAVELLSWESGEWDCHGRDAVLSCLRERVATGDNGGEIDLGEAGEDRLVASRRGVLADGPAAGLAPATLITLRDGSGSSEAAATRWRRCGERRAAAARRRTAGSV